MMQRGKKMALIDVIKYEGSNDTLVFKHPITEKEMRLEAPVPEYFKKILEQLKR